MKVESQNAGSCRVKLIVKAEADETRPDYELVVSRYMTQGRIKGFRPGHTPRPIVERHYRRDIDGEVRNRLISKFYRQALDAEKITPVAVVDVADVIFSPETGVSFVLSIDVAPEFKLPKYHKIPVAAGEATVSESQVAEQMDRMRNAVARFEDAAADYAVAAGDLACIDYRATCDGKPLQEVAGDCSGLAEGKEFWAKAAEPEFVPGVALGLIGLKAGESKDIKVKFEKDFHVESVRGKKAVYHVEVSKVRRCILPTDTELVAQFRVESVEQLTQRLRENMESSAKQSEAARQRQEIIDFLLKKTDFDLPQSQVSEETQLTVRHMLRDIVNRGGSREDIEKNREEILSNAATSAKDRVRLRYILTRIAAEEQIKADDTEVDERLKSMAAQYGMTVEKLRATIEERQGIDALRTDICAEKTLDFLVGDAKTK